MPEIKLSIGHFDRQLRIDTSESINGEITKPTKEKIKLQGRRNGFLLPKKSVCVWEGDVGYQWKIE